jgi:hypothetical protein
MERQAASTSPGSEDRPVLIGWKEYLDFPEWNVRRVKVKIDTGARTSALGALRCDLSQIEGQGLVARLQLALHRRHPERVLEVDVPVVQMVVVRNSGGIHEERPLIETAIRLGPVTKRIRLTVCRRAGMLFPMILGRRALAGDFVVDVSRKNLLKRRG